MKINESQRIGAVNNYKKNNEAKTAGTESKKQKLDEINISPEAKELQGAQGSHAKIEELKQSYSVGTYFVEARKVAEKLFPYIK